MTPSLAIFSPCWKQTCGSYILQCFRQCSHSIISSPALFADILKLFSAPISLPSFHGLIQLHKVFVIFPPASSAVARWSLPHTSAGLWCSPSPSAAAPQWPLTSSPASSPRGPRYLCRPWLRSPRSGWSPRVWAGMTGVSSLERQERRQI